MKEQNTAKAYAQSMIQLGLESKEDIVAELTKLTEAINSSNHLESLLFLNVFTVEEKTDIFFKVSDKLKLSKLTKNFITFLIQEKRIHMLPMIYKELVVIDDHNKGFMRGTIEGNEDSVDKKFQEKLASYLKEKLGVKTELKYVKNTQITAGYRVTVEDLQLDASIDNQLNQFKESILNS